MGEENLRRGMSHSWDGKCNIFQSHASSKNLSFHGNEYLSFCSLRLIKCCHLLMASVRPKEENLVSAETEYSATLAETFGRIFGRNWCLEIRKNFLWIVINKFYHATQFPLNYIRCNLNFKIRDFFNLRTHFHKILFKNCGFCPIFHSFYLAEYSAGWPKLSAEYFGRFGRKFRPNIRFRSYTRLNSKMLSLKKKNASVIAYFFPWNLILHGHMHVLTCIC